jgi:hypothetical protein
MARSCPCPPRSQRGFDCTGVHPLSANFGLSMAWRTAETVLWLAKVCRGAMNEQSRTRRCSSPVRGICPAHRSAALNPRCAIPPPSEHHHRFAFPLLIVYCSEQCLLSGQSVARNIADNTVLGRHRNRLLEVMNIALKTKSRKETETVSGWATTTNVPCRRVTSTAYR